MARYNFSSPGADVSEALTKLMADRKAEARQEMLDKFAREEQQQRMESATEYTRGLKAQREGVELDRKQADIKTELSMLGADEEVPAGTYQRVLDTGLEGLVKPGTPDQPALEGMGAEFTGPMAGDESPIEAQAGRAMIPGEAPTRRATPQERQQQDALRREQDSKQRQSDAMAALPEGPRKQMLQDQMQFGKTAAEGAYVPKEKAKPAAAQEFEYAQTQGFQGSFDQYQNDDANRKRPVTRITNNGPSASATNRRVDSIVTNFSGHQITQRYNKALDAVKFVDGMDINTKSPADDMALIYSFAKAMDPDSAVREGEYATVQRYAQALSSKVGFDIGRVFDETQLLTPDSRKQLIATIRARSKPILEQYANHYSEAQRRIEKVDPSQVDMLPEFQTGGSPAGGSVEFERNAQGKLVRKK